MSDDNTRLAAMQAHIVSIIAPLGSLQSMSVITLKHVQKVDGDLGELIGRTAQLQNLVMALMEGEIVTLGTAERAGVSWACAAPEPLVFMIRSVRISANVNPACLSSEHSDRS